MQDLRVARGVRLAVRCAPTLNDRPITNIVFAIMNVFNCSVFRIVRQAY